VEEDVGDKRADDCDGEGSQSDHGDSAGERDHEQIDRDPDERELIEMARHHGRDPGLRGQAHGERRR
jgi:hypothetical protein